METVNMMRQTNCFLYGHRIKRQKQNKKIRKLLQADTHKVLGWATITQTILKCKQMCKSPFSYYNWIIGYNCTGLIRLVTQLVQIFRGALGNIGLLFIKTCQKNSAPLSSVLWYYAKEDGKMSSLQFDYQKLKFLYETEMRLRESQVLVARKMSSDFVVNSRLCWKALSVQAKWSQKKKKIVKRIKAYAHSIYTWMSANVCLEGEKKSRNKNIREQFAEPLLHLLNGKCCAECAAAGRIGEWCKSPIYH